MKLPRHIVKKSKTWYLDTVSGKYIHKDHIANYITKWTSKN